VTSLDAISVSADTSDLDEDSATDSYIEISWSALAATEADVSSVAKTLAALSFDIIEAGFDSDTAISFSAIEANGSVSFESGNNPVGELQIDSVTGEVTLTADPDHETQAQYNFSVVATDATGNTSDAKAVTLDINNLDEVSPAFTSGKQASVEDGSESGQTVYIAITNDTGDISNNDVIYSFAGNLHDPALEINSKTGEVTLNEVPDFDTKPSYTFSILADDQVAENEIVIHRVTLNVSNIDEVSPVINSGEVATAVDENSGAGQVVYTATAADTDFNGAEVVTFGLAYAAPTIAIADYQSVYISESQVQDNGEDPDTPDTLHVKVAYQSDVEESLGLRIHFDSDALSFASISSELESLVTSLDAISASADTSDLDENSATDSYIEISWSALAGPEEGESIVTEALAALSFDIESGFDKDTAISFSAIEANGSVRFESGNNPVGELQIDSVTGEVTLTADPDHETKSEYNFSVIATDATGNTSDAKAVTLDINNLDEIAPTITSSAQAEDNNNTVDDDGNEVAVFGELNENSGAGQVIYTATADDSADVSDGVIFSLSNDSDDALSINSSTGDVRLATNPDHEVKSQYSFSVIAADAAGNTSEAKAVTLVINNIDDALPEFTSGIIATPIDENSGAGTVIYKATADDSLDISAGVTFSLSDDSDAALSINADGEVILDSDANYEDQD
jgi:hypothetical protein